MPQGNRLNIWEEMNTPINKNKDFALVVLLTVHNVQMSSCVSHV